MSPTPPHHTTVGHTPPYRHIYAQWLAPASGGTLDIEHWILWVGSVLLIINSIKPYTFKLSDIFAQLLQTVFMKAISFVYNFCLHAISSLNTNPSPISNPTIPPTPSFLLQPTFYLPYICSCSPFPLCLPILCIYLHIA